jgi:flagellar hook-length control protein FliK
MDDALDAPRTLRRDDSGALAPRRAEPARPRETMPGNGAASARKASAPGNHPAERKTEHADEPDAKARTRRETDASGDDTPVADAPVQTTTEAKTKPDANAEGDGPGDTDADAASGEPENAGTAAAAAPATAALGVNEPEDGTAVSGGDSPARGRRWELSTSAPAAEPGKGSRMGPSHKGSNGAIPTGAHAAETQVAAAPTPGEGLGDLASDAVTAGEADTSGDTTATGAPVPQAAQTAAATPQTASAPDAASAIENAVAAVETVAASEASTHADTGGSDPREQGQPKPQTPASQHTVNNEVAAAGGPSDGMRFTVNGATGNAAYTNAAPRHEEAVLPQIVQSIRLHAVQGTTEARVQLRPDHLGGLNITLKVEQNQVTATIQADVAAVRSWIESHESSLRQALSDQGLHLAKLVVQEDGQQASPDEQDGDRPRRQPQRRRSSRDDEVTFEVLV